jgi:hypothetical protein
MELIKEIIIESPPTFYTIKKKRESEKLGYDVFDKYYLTSNLFFNNATSFHIISKIVQHYKVFLRDNIKYLPPLEKMRLEVEYHSLKAIDLDNKLYWWTKLFLDIIKTPTQKQIDKANNGKYKKEIITLNVLYDDTTDYIDDIKWSHKRDTPKLIFRIYGRVKSQQQNLDLFFK